VGALGANLLTQVIIARYPTTADYGAFAFAIVVTGLAALGAPDSSGEGT